MEEIQEILGRHVRQSASDEDRRKLNSWASESPINSEIIREYELIWSRSEDLRTDVPVDSDMAWLSFQDRLNSKTHELQVYRKTTGKYKWFAAASVILVLFAVYFYNQRAVDYLQVTTQTDNRRSFELPDGSTVWLNNYSDIKYQEKENFRSVQLSGEVFFEVEKDTLRPFIIHTGDLKTRVVGTSFRILSRSDADIQVTVVSGKVQVYDDKDTMLLTKGEGISYDRDEHSIVYLDGWDRNTLSWQTGVLVFDDSSLQYVIQMLEEHYNVTLNVSNKAAESRLTATFDTMPLEEILQMITLTTDVKLNVSNN